MKKGTLKGGVAYLEKSVAHSVLCYGDALACSMAYQNTETKIIPTSLFANNVMAKHLNGWLISAYLNWETGKNG